MKYLGCNFPYYSYGFFQFVSIISPRVYHDSLIIKLSLQQRLSPPRFIEYGSAQGRSEELQILYRVQMPGVQPAPLPNPLRTLRHTSTIARSVITDNPLECVAYMIAGESPPGREDQGGINRESDKQYVNHSRLHPQNPPSFHSQVSWSDPGRDLPPKSVY